MRRMQATDRRVTYTELLQWPDNGRRYELYDGEVVEVPAPIIRHQRVALHVMDVLHGYEEATAGIRVPAPFDIVLSEHDVLQPDVVFFRSERRHLLHDWEPARVRPDLAVEVLSPSTQSRDRGRKMAVLARFGVPEYWLVDPAKNTIEIYALRDGVFVLALAVDALQNVVSPTLPGLSFAASRLFAA